MIRALFIAIGTLALAASPAPAVVIDDFTQAPIELTHVFAQSGFTRATQTGLDPNHVAGGVRAWNYNVRAQFQSDPPATAAVRTGVRLEPTPHLYYDADDLLTAINYQVLYNAGATSTSQPGLNLDLGVLRHNALAIDFDYALFDDDNGYFDIQAGPYIYTRVPNSATPFRLIHPFSKSLTPSGLIKSIALGTGNGYLFGSFEITRISTVSTADANFDGSVDGADFLIWQRNFGLPLPPIELTNAQRVAHGDANLDGVVNAADHAIWRQSFASAPAAGASNNAVPEPPSAAILAVAAAMFAGLRRQF
jgi:hypothetical protein